MPRFTIKSSIFALIVQICLLTSTKADLLPGIKLSNSNKQADSSIVVYVANEPDPEIYGRLANWLRSNPETSWQKSAAALEKDAEKFPRIVKNEIEKLIKNAKENDRVGLGVFTNELGRRGKFLYLPPESEDVIEMDIAFMDSELAVFQHHPVSHPTAIKRIVAAIGNAAKTEKSVEFALISKSHGNSEFCLATAYGPIMDANTESQAHTMVEEVLNSSKLKVVSNVEKQFNIRLAAEVENTAGTDLSVR